MMVLDIWRNASPKRKRIYSVIVVFVLSVIITLVGSLMPLDAEQARQISERLNQTLTTARESEMLMQYIFGNNFFICLIMFIPIVGPIFGFFVLFSTGAAASAVAAAQGFPSILALIALVITPVFWLEYAAYSTAMAASVWLFRRILQGRGRNEFRNTCLFITLCAVLLAAGAAVETALITLAT
ncbi:MAG: stage II sporulation protein M [Candidatus Bathyarchaeales archaeon]